MTNQVFTFGCRLNAYESEVMKGHLAASGREDVAVFNSCAVTREAERQVGQAIRKFRRQNPDARIVVTGCAAQIDPSKYAAMAEVDQVLGNDEKLRAESYGAQAEERVLVNDIMSVQETAPQMVEGLEGHARAFMQVQNGCDHRCTFCIIPFGRGNSRSVPMGEIVAQARALVASGYAEIVLTGVDVSSYGGDLPGEPSLGQMVRRLLAAVPELRRLRLSSIDVAEIDEDLMAVFASEPRFMPYFHLSLQAGDDMILKRMKRRHSRQDAIDFCARARELRSDVTFGADIIVGFPTETEAMFENTMALVREAGLQWLHVFPYSERDGTPAAKIPAAKQVDVAVRKQRAKRLRELGEQQVAAYLQSRIGAVENVVVEKGGVGRTEGFGQVRLGAEHVEGEVVTVTTSRTDGVFLYC